jgi:predicted nucleic acid-binding protein
MKRVRSPVSVKRRRGVLDAGVLIGRLDPRRRGHAEISGLLDRSAQGSVSLYMSVVNLAEVLQHSRGYIKATGVDPISLLEGFRIAIHLPDVALARRVAELASLEDTSLADRFAAATAEALGARLYTTDSALASALKPRRLPVTLF